MSKLEFITNNTPEAGSLHELADGVFWLRMSLPMSGLNHINLYIIKDKTGFVIIDTGLGWHEAKTIWADIFAGQFKNQKPNRIICTHLHPDHTGLAGWLCDKFNVPLLMSRSEYILCRLLAADTGKPAPKAGIEFYQRAGLNNEQILHYKSRFGGFGKAISPMPMSYIRLKEGDKIKINSQNWHIMTGSGHSPEHVCLYNQTQNIIISGDQILPNISSNVGVWPTEPEADPLSDWLKSCKRFINDLPEDVLVLPAHGIPFIGAHARLAKLINHHAKSLDRLLEFCQRPRKANECFSIMFKRKIDESNMLMAVGETIAHLNYLLNKNLISRNLNENGQYIYQTK